MKHFTTFKLQRLQDEDIRKASKRIAAVVEKQDVEVFHLTGKQRLLVAAIVAMQLKQVYNRKMVQTKLVRHTKSEISRIYGTILSLVKAYKRGNVAAQVVHLNVLLPYLDLYTKSVAVAVANSDEPVLDDLFLALAKDANANAAIVGLQMKELFDELLLNVTTLSEITSIRDTAISTRKDNNFRALRVNTEKAIRNLMLFIELAIVEYPELNYGPLVSNINVIIIEFNAKLDAKATRKENKGIEPDTTEAA